MGRGCALTCVVAYIMSVMAWPSKTGHTKKKGEFFFFFKSEISNQNQNIWVLPGETGHTEKKGDGKEDVGN